MSSIAWRCFTNTSAFHMNTARNAEQVPATNVQKGSPPCARLANRRYAVQLNQLASARYSSTNKARPPMASQACVR
jgi:hypothetical protein